MTAAGVAGSVRAGRWAPIGLVISGAMLTLPSPTVEAAIAVSLCSGSPGCICVDWDYGGGTYLEVRCPGGSADGWTTEPSGEGPNGPTDSWGGGPGLPGPEAPEPGTPLTGNLLYRVGLAVSEAREGLTPDLVYDEDQGKLVEEPTECTRLFDGNPTGHTGRYLLNQHVVFRNGEGVTGPGGSVPCAQGKEIWTTCCSHRRYIFICDGFEDVPLPAAAANIIHELMHVAGQTEDSNGATGPGNPPNSGQITAVVKAACSL